MNKPKIMITVNVEALPVQAADHHVDTLIYGRLGEGEWGIKLMMDIAERYGVKLTFFVDFAEVELYGEEMIEVGRYIVSRGHDLQIYCHFELLREQIKSHFHDVDDDYTKWCEDKEISSFIIDYCLSHYRDCGATGPIVFRGGDYQFGAAMIRILKEKGVAADATYNSLGPKSRPVNRQFMFENGLFEFPVGITEREGENILFDFNSEVFYPTDKDDLGDVLKNHEKIFAHYYEYFGGETIANFVMHSWSFCFNRQEFQSNGYINQPNLSAAEYFDMFLAYFSRKYEFVMASQVIEQIDPNSLKCVDIESIFALFPYKTSEEMRMIYNYISRKAHGRDVVIWGRGYLETQYNQILNYEKFFEAPFYISADAQKYRMWRGKPVKTFEESELSPDRYYVLILARSKYTEIRNALQTAGFREYEDYYDIEESMPREPKRGLPCPVCGGEYYMRFLADKPNMCMGCGAVARHRTGALVMKKYARQEHLNGKILHVSPYDTERTLFQRLGAKNITTLDIRPEEKTDIVADLSHMEVVKSDQFDFVFACGVLNCVFKYEDALAEMCRILRKRGLLILRVAMSGMRNKKYGNPSEAYGSEALEQYQVGYFRTYGEVEFTEQLRHYFAHVRLLEKYDAIEQSSEMWFVCEK